MEQKHLNGGDSCLPHLFKCPKFFLNCNRDGCDQLLPNSFLAIFTAIRRAQLGGGASARLILEIDIGEFLAGAVRHDKAGVQFLIALIVVMTVVGSISSQIGRRGNTERVNQGSAGKLYGQSLQILLSGVQNKRGPVTALIAGANDTSRSWLTFTPALLMRETGVLPAQPLYFLPFLGPRFEAALPPPFRKPWTIMNSNPPDIVIMFPDSLHTNRDFLGADLAENVRTLVADHSYQVLLDTPQIFAASRIALQKR
jgi:hypothetical protein